MGRPVHAPGQRYRAYKTTTGHASLSITTGHASAQRRTQLHKRKRRDSTRYTHTAVACRTQDPIVRPTHSQKRSLFFTKRKPKPSPSGAESVHPTTTTYQENLRDKPKRSSIGTSDNIILWKIQHQKFVDEVVIAGIKGTKEGW